MGRLRCGVYLMADIFIEWLTDSCECETCGTSYADGAVVTIKFLGTLKVINLEPVAHCFDDDNYSSEAIYKRILDELGHKVFESYEGEE